MTEKVKTVIGAFFLLPDFKSRGHPMRAYTVLQNWPKMAKMTPGDLLALKRVLTEAQRNIEQNTVFKHS